MTMGTYMQRFALRRRRVRGVRSKRPAGQTTRREDTSANAVSLGRQASLERQAPVVLGDPRFLTCRRRQSGWVPQDPHRAPVEVRRAGPMNARPSRGATTRRRTTSLIWSARHLPYRHRGAARFPMASRRGAASTWATPGSGRARSTPSTRPTPLQPPATVPEHRQPFTLVDPANANRVVFCAARRPAPADRPGEVTTKNQHGAVVVTISAPPSGHNAMLNFAAAGESTHCKFCCLRRHNNYNALAVKRLSTLSNRA